MADPRDDRAAPGIPWLVLVPAAVVVAVLAAHLPVYLRYRRNHAAAAEVTRLGGQCNWTPGKPPPPLERLGETYAKLYARLSGVSLLGTPVTDADLAHLKGLTVLQDLELRHTPVTDAGLAHLKGLTGLRGLVLGNTGVTDAGLAHLKGLTGLHTLWLKNTAVTDAGLVHLKGLTGLRRLLLSNTAVTDAGLAHLTGLTGLQVLVLTGTAVTGAGVRALEAALPGCTIYGP